MLQRLKSLSKPIKVGIIGAGAMGKGLLYQCSITPGMRCVALADKSSEKAVDAVTSLGLKYDTTESASGMKNTIGRGEVAICTDGMLVAECKDINVLIEATSSIVEGAQFVEAALRAGTPVVLMNSEIDQAFRPYFDQLATENGTVCSSIDGDQYGVIKHLIDDLQMWGFDLVMAGNIKGFLNREANPTNIRFEADKRDLDYKMCTAYTDGTKLCVEMSILANAYGLRTDIPGMRGPRAGHVKEALTLFDFDKIWDKADSDFPIVARRGLVDYILGAEPGGGVFAIGYHQHPYQNAMLEYYKMGAGPYYLFYRPYHLCHVEGLESVAATVLDGESLLQPKYAFATEVYAYAKHDLHKGDYLDGIGGYKTYGMIDNCEGGDWTEEGLPISISDDLRLRRSVGRNEPIMVADVKYSSDSPAFELYGKARRAGEK